MRYFKKGEGILVRNRFRPHPTTNSLSSFLFYILTSFLEFFSSSTRVLFPSSFKFCAASIFELKKKKEKTSFTLCNVDSTVQQKKNAPIQYYIINSIHFDCRRYLWWCITIFHFSFFLSFFLSFLIKWMNDISPTRHYPSYNRQRY